MTDLLLIVGGIILTYVTKNRRWLIVTLFGVLWVIVDVLLIAFRLAGS